MNLQEAYDDWAASVIKVKNHVVAEQGPCTDIHPTFGAMRSISGARILGYCGNTMMRAVITCGWQPQTKWSALCRQVVTLTGAGIAFAAVEILAHDNDEEVEAIEITAIDKDDSITVIHPYKYNVGRTVNWLPTRDPHPIELVRGTAWEMDAARRAWAGDQVAYKASIKHLSTECGTQWIGDLELLFAIGAPIEGPNGPL